MSRYNQTHDFERDLGGSRKVYNLGGHQSSLLDNFDITASGGARRYDQIFDS